MANFVSYSNMQVIMGGIAEKFNSLNGAYIIKGSIAFASLPATPTSDQSGYVYNITDDFTTDARFIEGAGKDYPAGTNVVIADLSTYAVATPVSDPAAEGLYELVNGKYVLTTDTSIEVGKTYYAKTTDVKYDVISSFVDVAAIEDAIKAVSDMIAAEFDETTGAYAIGDLVVKDGVLYKFKAAHTAGDPWDATEVDEVTVDSLLDALATKLDTEVANIFAVIASTFDPTENYVAGQYVVKDKELYVFDTDHAAGAWVGTDATKVEIGEVLTGLAGDIDAVDDRVDVVVGDLAPAFSAASQYEEGDVVTHADGLYKFKAGGHTAGDPWSDSEVDAVVLSSLVDSAEPDPLTTEQVNALLALLD